MQSDFGVAHVESSAQFTKSLNKSATAPVGSPLYMHNLLYISHKQEFRQRKGYQDCFSTGSMIYHHLPSSLEYGSENAEQALIGLFPNQGAMIRSYTSLFLVAHAKFSQVMKRSQIPSCIIFQFDVFFILEF